MTYVRYPVIDLPATGENILRLRESRGFSVRDLQQFFGFDAPQAIYKWQRGQTLPSVDNLFALSALFQVPIENILIASMPAAHQYKNEQQAPACCSASGSPKKFIYGGKAFPCARTSLRSTPSPRGFTPKTPHYNKVNFIIHYKRKSYCKKSLRSANENCCTYSRTR